MVTNWSDTGAFVHWFDKSSGIKDIGVFAFYWYWNLFGFYWHHRKKFDFHTKKSNILVRGTCMQVNIIYHRRLKNWTGYFVLRLWLWNLSFFHYIAYLFGLNFVLCVLYSQILWRILEYCKYQLTSVLYWTVHGWDIELLLAFICCFKFLKFFCSQKPTKNMVILRTNNWFWNIHIFKIQGKICDYNNCLISKLVTLIDNQS